MSSGINDRLEALRQSCILKYSRLEEISNSLRETEENIEAVLSEFPPDVSFHELNVKVAVMKLDLAQTQQLIKNEGRRLEALKSDISQHQEELAGHVDAYECLAVLVEEREEELHRHEEAVCDAVNMFRERFEMAREELCSLRAMNAELFQVTTHGPRSQWLKRLLHATQIQRKEIQGYLARAEAVQSRLK